jgi:hypothetical protein
VYGGDDLYSDIAEAGLEQQVNEFAQAVLSAGAAKMLLPEALAARPEEYGAVAVTLSARPVVTKDLST